jgi:hypothetical protein
MMGMTTTLSLGQQLAELSLKARKRQLKSKKAWSEHMKKVRAHGKQKKDAIAFDNRP